MKRYIYRFFLVVACMSIGIPAIQAQGSTDERARELVSLARKYYNTKNYLDAAMTFELAMQRPENELSNFSSYMSGLSYYRANEKDKAHKALDKFISTHPYSTYQEDARYHRALILMESSHVSDKEKGLDEMFKLHAGTGNARLKADVESSTRFFLANVFDVSFLDLYSVFVQKEYLPWIMEGMCQQLDKAGDGFKLLEKLTVYRDKGGIMTPLLYSLEQKYKAGKVTYADRLNIAIFLSFNLQRVDTASVVPKRSQKAIEMLEGMLIALDSVGKSLNKRINVSIYDTQGDTIGLATQLDSLERFQPDVIIGDMRTAIAEMISDWAEAHKVIHLIPRNAFNKLIENKKYTFLVHPSLNTHGAAMARYLYQIEGKRRFLIFNDNTFYSDKFSQAFKAELAGEADAAVVERTVPSHYKEFQVSISAEIKSMRNNNYDVVYAPISNEESAGFIISKLNYDRITTEVVGGPDWETFTVIDQELKTAYKLKYSAFYYESNDSLAFDELYGACLQSYAYRPSPYTVQGFDIMSWLLTVNKNVSPAYPFLKAIHEEKSYHGIHQDIYFGENQDNQKINVLQYNYGRTDKVNRDQ